MFVAMENAYLEIVLKILKLFCFLAGFGWETLTLPFIPFEPGSASRPLLSTAIFYSMDPNGGGQSQVFGGSLELIGEGDNVVNLEMELTELR